MMKSVNVVTSNVEAELRQISMKNATSPSKLYLEVKAVNTFLKNINSERIEIDSSELNKYKDETLLRDNLTEFEQEYDITVKPVDSNYPFKNMISEIEFQEDDTLAYLVIKKGSKLSFYPQLYSDFINYITEQKLRSNIMLYLFDVDYKQSIKEFVDVIEKVKKITFKDDKKILVSKGLTSVESVSAEICMNIEEDNDIGTEDSEGKIDYSNRGFLLSCTEGDQLFEFIKPQQGKYGRTCKGEVIDVEVVNLDTKPTFTVDNGIEVQDSFENIKYFSKKSGYLVKTGNKYDVSNSIDVNEISFKTTGTINTDLDSEISINVIKSNPLEDAIEEGMHVKVQKLSVKGSVGPKTEIEARDVSIDGQTHSESFIKCVNATLGHHKGTIIGRKVEAVTLDGGKIIADQAVVYNAMRGTIKAKTIEINTLGSYVIMEASESIEINMTKGEDNKFIIDTSIKSPFESNNIDDDKDYLKKLEDELKPLVKTLKDTAKKIKKNLEPCEKIKATIIKNKKQGVKISDILVKNFKLCQVIRVHYKKQKEDCEYKKSQIEKLKKKLINIDSNMFDAKITLKQPLNGYNTITYRLNNPQREISLKSDEKMNKTVFKLIEDDDGILRVVNSD